MLRLITQSRRRCVPPAVGLFMAALSLAGCGHKKAPAPNIEANGPRAAVRVAMAESRPALATEEVVGTVRSKLRASIEAKVTARIEQMLVAPGDTVRAGALLVQLDQREIQSRLDQAIPVLRNAEIELKRFKSLLEQRAVSQQELDAIEARLRVAQATVTEAETMLGYTKITAPFAGVITRKLADVGDLAVPGRALLEIEDPRALRVEADIPESLIDRLQLGAKLRVSVGSATQPVDAVVSEIAPAADSATRTFLVKLDLPEQTGLRAGRFARLAVPLGESHALRIPISAVIQRGQMELAFVADGDRARLRLVKTGKRLGNEVEVVSGIAAGDRVIFEGTEQLHDGQAIQVKP